MDNAATSNPAVGMWPTDAVARALSRDNRPEWLRNLPGADRRDQVYYRFLWEYSREYGPLNCLELGTYYGVGALHLADGHAETRVVTVDISGRRATSQSREHERITRIVGNDVAEETVVAVGHHLPFDLCFFDSYHNRAHVVEQIRLYEPMLLPGALELFDDINLTKLEDPREPDRTETARKNGYKRPAELAADMRLLWLSLSEPKQDFDILHPGSGFGMRWKT